MNYNRNISLPARVGCINAVNTFWLISKVQYNLVVIHSLDVANNPPYTINDADTLDVINV